MRTPLALSALLSLSFLATPALAKKPSQHGSKLPTGSGKVARVNAESSVRVDAAAEQAVVEMVNAERAAYGLAPLTVDPRLREAARVHSRDMAEHDFFSHDSPVRGRSSFTDRIKEQGLSKFGAAGENIAMAYYGPSERAAGFMEMWMNSEGHRANILTEDFRYIGVGIYVDEAGRVFASQEFSSLGSASAAPKKPLTVEVAPAPAAPVAPVETYEQDRFGTAPNEEYFPEEEFGGEVEYYAPEAAEARDMEAEKRRLYEILEALSRGSSAEDEDGPVIIVVPERGRAPRGESYYYYYTPAPQQAAPRRPCR